MHGNPEAARLPVRATIPALVPFSLPVRLGLLVAAMVLPLTIFGAVLVYYNYENNRRTAYDGVLQIARGLSSTADGELRTAIASLEVLALSEALQRDDLDEFRRQAETYIAANFPDANVVLSDGGGQQLLNTAVPPGTPLPQYLRMDALKRVFERGEPQISDLLVGPVLERYSIVVDVPVRHSGRIVYDLAASVPLQVFADVILLQRPDPDWTVAIFDRRGLALARMPGGERVIGQRASATLFPALMAAYEGVLDTVTVEGVEALTGFARSPFSGWSAAVGIPKSNLTKALWRSVAVLSGFGALCFSIGIVVAARLAAHVARSEADRDLLINELNHRVKNTLATVQSMAVNTLKTHASTADARKAIEERLVAMSRTHDLLTDQHWKSVELRELLDSIVDPYRAYQGQIRLHGPDLRLNPRAAVTMAMIVNELTTNAVKYGALSRIGGTLTLAWQVVGNGKAPTLKLTWREDNGAQAAAPVAPPQRRGFGSLLIEQGVTRELQGSLSSQFEPGGLVSTIELPLKRVIATRYAARGRLRERLPASP